MSITPTFQGELQLAGWSDTHTGGAKVTFWLPDAESLEVFRTLTVRKGNTAGHRFMAVLVEIGDDEQPVQPNPPNPGELEKPKGGELAKLAGMWCNDERFIGWLRGPRGYWVEDAEEAAQFIRHECGVDSRAKLDSMPEAAERFHRLIRGPFIKYLRASEVPA